MTSYPLQKWIDEPRAEDIEYAGYWNDAEAERDKPWWILDGDFQKLEHYLDEVGLRQDLQQALTLVEELTGRPLRGHGIDLAAGTLWAAPLVLASGPVERLYCLEFSRHRLLEIGPRVLDHYGVPTDRVVLVYGSFYDLDLPDDSLDFALMVQAFHHADRPEALLAELRRVLKPEGVAIVVGEHRLRPRHYLVHAAKVALSFLPGGVQERVLQRRIEVRRTLRPTAAELEPPDPVLGDHAYSRADYQRFFAESGFRARRFRRRGGEYQGFVLW